MNFVTLFNTKNVHITKDVGIIPYGMYRYYEYDAYCASYDNGPYTLVDTECKGLKMWFVKKYTGIFKVDALFFLMKHSKEIDVLNVYHVSPASSVIILLYRLLNQHGKVYWKTDGSGIDKSSGIKYLICHMAMKRCALVSCEVEENKKKLEGNWGGIFAHVPNPYSPAQERHFKPYRDRSNIILTVGMLGTKPKATEILMEGFKMAVREMGLTGWKLELVGSIEKKETDFEAYINDWYEENPDMKPLVSFEGVINDKEQLYDTYQTAKVFALPSRSESYGIVSIEAALSGCFIIATDISATREITENFKYAASFSVDDVRELAKQLVRWCNDEAGMEQKARMLYESVCKNNALDRICGIINEGIRKVGVSSH